MFWLLVEWSFIIYILRTNVDYSTKNHHMQIVVAALPVLPCLLELLITLQIVFLIMSLHHHQADLVYHRLLQVLAVQDLHSHQTHLSNAVDLVMLFQLLAVVLQLQ